MIETLRLKIVTQHLKRISTLSLPFKKWLLWLIVQVVITTLLSHPLIVVIGYLTAIWGVIKIGQETSDKAQKKEARRQLAYFNLFCTLRGTWFIYAQAFLLIQGQLTSARLLLGCIPFIVEGIALLRLKQYITTPPKPKKTIPQTKQVWVNQETGEILKEMD